MQVGRNAFWKKQFYSRFGLQHVHSRENLEPSQRSFHKSHSDNLIVEQISGFDSNFEQHWHSVPSGFNLHWVSKFAQSRLIKFLQFAGAHLAWGQSPITWGLNWQTSSLVQLSHLRAILGQEGKVQIVEISIRSCICCMANMVGKLEGSTYAFRLLATRQLRFRKFCSW